MAHMGPRSVKSLLHDDFRGFSSQQELYSSVWGVSVLLWYTLIMPKHSLSLAYAWYLDLPALLCLTRNSKQVATLWVRAWVTWSTSANSLKRLATCRKPTSPIHLCVFCKLWKNWNNKKVVIQHIFLLSINTFSSCTCSLNTWNTFM